MSDYDMSEALQYAMTAVDRLCDTVGKTHFEPADPDSEFHWSHISQHTGRTGLYQKFANWLLDDNHVRLEDKKLALDSVVNNLCAQLERVAWIWSPVVVINDLNVPVASTYKSIKERWSQKEIYDCEELDMCMNSGYVFHAAEQWMNIYNSMLRNPTSTSKAKM